MKFLILFSLILAYASGSKLQNGRIANGEQAAERQYPSQVGLVIQKNGETFWCGGSLITPEWILTAAHCIDKSNGGTAYLGTIVMEKSEHSIPFTPSDMIIHEGYNFPLNDIALIHIKPIQLSDSVQTIKLADGSLTYENSRAIAVGWGRTGDAKSVSQNLNHATLIVVPLAECRSAFGGIPESNICVSTKSGKSICKGDSGGPLISRLDGKLIGVTSFQSVAGCEAGYPVVFVRVTSFLDWIKSKTGNSLT